MTCADRLSGLRWIAVPIVAFVLASPAVAQGMADEYDVKAAMTYNFAKFVTWPAGGAADAGRSLMLCVMAGKQVLQAFEALAGRAVADRTLAVRAVSAPTPADACHILYVSASTPDTVPRDVLARFEGRPVLTVSDAPGFTSAGGMIGLVTVERRIRFEIHLGAAETAGLVLSSRLLALATAVHRGGREARL